MKFTACIFLFTVLATVMALPNRKPSAAVCDPEARQKCYIKECSIAACCGLEAGANLRACHTRCSEKSGCLG
ncbi:hypothetical protein PCANC_11593 [Puccinia coronata f. sp. avenae]|uniref:Uncharacterized protein n=1 Tax=Puccinia coronata f. sp. avenae TaxID=200324 RepID=A0A2N5V7V8_9BASI|nr:hypothetical protein PCASD_18298 [Puccinia coronata f. sp. avenae]PLW18933.1 hypothetical protein PCANC_12835 [Puccinia coronata f. sp. avenae]PLW46072.1 hypothetical protein PCANC_11593 [Puccinia coronata f. sp. avenae]